ncbi:hypothetical protein H206_02034 [Candidatus Electrothrix aarhusensis]|uniref:Uncharacterized protein n=1 Tax=Candidatus Electrothrix aarhusensis TaxID=1859131 RepID=A0A3S3QGM7_9BACT|nr:hypothetical protein H206_02034 [Candidatus Electrothrix aarhusensis]
MPGLLSTLPTLASLFKSRSDVSHFFKDFDNESAINKPRYAKYIKVDEMNFKSLKKWASLEMEKIKPLIESIL